MKQDAERGRGPTGRTNGRMQRHTCEFGFVVGQAERPEEGCQGLRVSAARRGQHGRAGKEQDQAERERRRAARVTARVHRWHG